MLPVPEEFYVFPKADRLPEMHISDIERILDEVVFIRDGKVVRHEAVDDIKEKEGKSIDDVFKDSFRMVPYAGVNGNDR